MKFSIIATIIATTTAQVTIVRPDKTTGVINSAPGCYGIYPTVKEVKNANGLKLEYYNDWNCKGTKVDESIGNKVFNNPVNAVSIKVSPGTRARYLREHSQTRVQYDDEDDYGYLPSETYSNESHNSYELDQEVQGVPVEDLVDLFKGFLHHECSIYEGIVQGCNNL